MDKIYLKDDPNYKPLPQFRYKSNVLSHLRHLHFNGTPVDELTGTPGVQVRAVEAVAGGYRLRLDTLSTEPKGFRDQCQGWVELNPAVGWSITGFDYTRELEYPDGKKN